MKNINIMKNIHSFIKSNCGIGGISSVSRRYFVLFITLLSLGVGQMWAATWTFSGGTMYFDNRNTQWSDGHISLLIGKSSYTSVYEMEAIPGTTLYKCSLPSSGWGDAEYMTIVSTTVSWDSGKWGPDNRTNAEHYTNTYTDGHSGNASYIITPSSNSNDCSIAKTDFTTISNYVHPDVLSATKVMVYGGVATSWGQSTYYFMSSNSTSSAVATSTKKTGVHDVVNINNIPFWFGIAVLPATDYYQGHWNSGLQATISAGNAYLVYNNPSTDYFTKVSEGSSGNQIYKVKNYVGGSSAPTTSVTTTLGSSYVMVGTSNLSVSTGSAGYSIWGNTNSVKYYLYNGNTTKWSLVTLSAGKLDVSGLSAGHYKLATIISDEEIHVRADLDEFDVYDTWAMYSGSTKIGDFTTTDGIHYSLTDFVINNDNKANTKYKCSSNVSFAQAGAVSLVVSEASARTLTFDNGQIAWQDGNGTYDIHIVYNSGWKIYAEQKSVEETWYWIEGNGAQTGSESVTKQLMDATAVSGVYSCTRTLTQNQTFHFGNTIKGYGPNSTVRGALAYASVIATSTNIGLEAYGSVYWFQFTPASQPVKMTLNTNTDPYTISFSNPVYTITYKDQGGSAYSGSNGSSLPTSHTYGTATAFVNGVKTGYTFDGWFTDESCTVSAGSSIGATAITANTTYYAKWTEKTYTVTLVNATASSVTAGITTNPTITAASKNYATFDHWEVSGGASVASTTTSPTTVSATSAGSVTAVYSQSKYVFIEGRFLAYTSPSRQTIKYTNSNSGETYWSISSTNIQMQYDVNNDRFYLHTYATPNELKNIGGNNGFINLELSTSSSSLTGNTTYYANTNGQNLTTAGGKISFSNTSNEYRPYITSTATNKYVVLYWDGTYLWYEEETKQASINTVDLSAGRVPPGASITATPSMYVRGNVAKAYCWGLFSDEECTSVVSTSFTSAGNGAVTFTVPDTHTPTTYYLRLQIHNDDGCASAIDDEKVVSFDVTTDHMVFFKNVPGWGSVHVYFLGNSSYWDDNKGSGCAGRDNGNAHGMTRIGNSNVYYYDYNGNSNAISGYIAFTDNYKPNANNFSGCQAAYRGDFSTTCSPMYVPENYITNYMNTDAGDGQAAYYNRGYWTNYMTNNSGFTLHFYNSKTKNDGSAFLSHDMTATSIGDNTYSFTYDFSQSGQDAPYSYGFEVSGCGGAWYAISGDMNINNCTNWNLYTDQTRRGGVDINVNAEHKFILTLTGDGHIQLSVEYPPALGDYRLIYDDEKQNPHPSQILRKRAAGKDTVAMFVRTSASSESLKVQYVSSLTPITWSDYTWNSGSAAIDISGLSDGVYNFYLEQDGDGDLTVNTTETQPYTGAYYIRTQSVDGGWNAYKTSSDNRMTYTQYPLEMGYGYNYYKTKWVSPAGSNATFTIACDYSEALCDTMVADPGNNPLSEAQVQNLPQAANIRFGWNSTINKLTRAYISGSTNVSDRFLVLRGDAKMKDKDGRALTSGAGKVAGLQDHEMNFTDLGNWIYRADVKVVPGATIRLQADYSGHTQYFIGTAETPVQIIGGNGGTERLIRVTYDFKTNRLMSAWLPEGNVINENITLQADMMLIRKGQEAATQITFNSTQSITDIKTIYGVMEFQKSDIAGQFPNWEAEHVYEYLMYYISFPFDVRVRDIFGAGTMGENWIIQKYNGAKRAKIGWFAETSTFWETLPADSTLHKNEGYLLLLDRISFNDENNALWYKIPSSGSIYLYFPSVSNTIGTITDQDQTVTVPSHVCTIPRTFTLPGVAGTLDHRNTDSHWNVIGTPLFATKEASTIATPTADGNGATTLQYYYAWNSSDNTLAAQAAFNTSVTFKSMHSYMVQYAGNVTFHGAAITPASLAARRIQDNKNYRVELQLVSVDNKTSKTYIELRENACDTFALNEDMYMLRSSRTVDLYSFAGSYDVAANVLSMASHTVPLGIAVQKAGTYTFTMPSDFSGTVTLVDKYTQTRTNLAIEDYTVDLEQGTFNDRFLLEVDIQAVTTNLDQTSDGFSKDKTRKVMIDGILYIVKDGKMYDARGNKVK